MLPAGEHVKIRYAAIGSTIFELITVTEVPERVVFQTMIEVTHLRMLKLNGHQKALRSMVEFILNELREETARQLRPRIIR